MRKLALILAAAPFLMANGPPQPIPPEIRAMLDAALASGNDGEVSTIAKYAKKAAPDSSDAINQLVSHWRSARAEAQTRSIQQAGFLDLWKGSLTLGGEITTGNSRNKGLTGALDLKREGLNWRQKLHAQADYQESFGVTSREHYLASYEPNYKLGDRAYIYGAAQYESDRFVGFYDRYSASVGAGYSALKKPNLTLDVELGPAYRSTTFTDRRVESSVAARGSVDFMWRLSPGLKLKQDASAYVQHYNSTISSTSALEAKLFGPLSAQMSYTVQYESMPPVGSVSTDTSTRASLVYSF